MSYAPPLRDWLNTPLGQSLRATETELIAEALSHVFGRELLQIGLWGEPDELRAHARTSRSTVADATSGPGVSIRCDPRRLGIAAGSVDAVLLPHTLELHHEPHEVLREAERVLSGEGHLITLGFNPLSAWGLRRALSRGRFPAGVLRFIGEGRLRDWLALLGFDVEQVRRYYYRLPFNRGAAPGRSPRLERLGSRFWPRLSAGYLMLAKKRVYTLTPIRPVWNKKAAVVGGLVEPTTRSRVDRPAR